MHFSAAGYYAGMCAKNGLIGLAMSSTDPIMAVTGAVGRIIGNNPIAYAIPIFNHRMILFDIALSEISGLKILNYEKKQEALQPNWLVDKDGNPTTDPSEFLKGEALLPLSGHKGYGFAILTMGYVILKYGIINAMISIY